MVTENKKMPTSGEGTNRRMPTPVTQKESRVGVFVILGILAVVFMLYLLTDPATFRGRYKISTNVVDVMGLRKGDPIQMRGIPIGRVHDFSLQPGEEEVTIVLEVEGKWRIPVGSSAQLVSTGIMDPRTVKIIPGMGPGDIGEGSFLPGSITKSLFDDTESLGQKGQVVLEQMAALLSDSTVQTVTGSTQYLEKILGELSSIMDAEGEEIKALISSLSTAADHLSGAAQTAPELTGDLLATVERADLLVGDLTEAMADFDNIMVSLSGILERIDRGEGTLGMLVTNDELFFTLREAVESARILMDDLKENPSRYINISIF